MELRQLEHFVAVAEERHFTRAAARVGIVQSGLSASVRALERELGVALFERTRGIELTTAGEALLPEARRALAAARAGREAVEAVDGLRRGRLAIGLAQVLAPSVELIPILAAFHRDHPDVRLWLRHGLSDPLTELRASRSDLVFTPLVEPAGVDLNVTVLATDRMALACAPEHRLARRQTVELEELASEAFIDLPVDTATRVIVDRGFGAFGLTRHTAVEVDGLQAALDLIGRGVGVAILPESAAVVGGRAVVRPLACRLAWSFAAVERADRAANPAARAFVRRVLARTGALKESAASRECAGSGALPEVAPSRC